MSNDVLNRARAVLAPHAELALADIAAGAIVLDRAAMTSLRGAKVSPEEAATLREGLVRWLRTKNQFVTIERETEEEIESAIVRVVGEIGEAADLEEAQEALDDALDGLASILRDTLGEARREVVASEYAPDLQLAVLGLKLSDVSSPVLDVGCGSNALLVRHLRGLGHDVTGIDRDAPSDATRADWLAFDYGNAKWRTIVSHLGFSLHFQRAHRVGEAEARTYAETFVKITRSLVVGGTFAYAPSVPFFESVLPASRFRIAHTRVPQSETLASLREKSGLDLGEATQLVRLA